MPTSRRCRPRSVIPSIPIEVETLLLRALESIRPRASRAPPTCPRAAPCAAGGAARFRHRNNLSPLRPIPGRRAGVARKGSLIWPSRASSRSARSIQPPRRCAARGGSWRGPSCAPAPEVASSSRRCASAAVAPCRAGRAAAGGRYPRARRGKPRKCRASPDGRPIAVGAPACAADYRRGAVVARAAGSGVHARAPGYWRRPDHSGAPRR